MTFREREIFSVVKELKKAHPTAIGKRMGISADYAIQLCRDMIWAKYFVQKGLYYEIAPGKESLH